MAGSIRIGYEVSYDPCNMRSLSDDRFFRRPVEKCDIEMRSDCTDSFIWINGYLERVVSGVVALSRGYPGRSAQKFGNCLRISQLERETIVRVS